MTSEGDPELRYRTLFNLGFSHLDRGLAGDSTTRNEALDGALAAYKAALLHRSDDLDSKWNYELALRRREGGGGGGGGGQSGGGGSSSQDQPQPRGGLCSREAEQLLASAAREERDVQARKQQQTRVEPPPGGKSW
jgi:Ca-activated chloride channel family protein